MMKQLSLEFGGKNLRKLFDSANLEQSVATLILAAFPNQVSIVKRQGRFFSTQLQTKSFHHRRKNLFYINVTLFLKKNSQNKVWKELWLFVEMLE